MRRLLLLPLILALVVQSAVAGGHRTSGAVHVRSYYRSNGTHVNSYKRAAPRGASYSVTRSTGLGTRGVKSWSGTSAFTPRTSTAYVPKMSTLPKTTPIFPKAVPVMRTTTDSLGVQRDSHGRIKRSESAKYDFMRTTGYPHGRPGYLVDHIVPLKRGGCDCPSNMQWQTIQEAKAKDKWE